VAYDSSGLLEPGSPEGGRSSAARSVPNLRSWLPLTARRGPVVSDCFLFLTLFYD
jgi:hypothetical protein